MTLSIMTFSIKRKALAESDHTYVFLSIADKVTVILTFFIFRHHFCIIRPKFPKFKSDWKAAENCFEQLTSVNLIIFSLVYLLIMMSN